MDRFNHTWPIKLNYKLWQCFDSQLITTTGRDQFLLQSTPLNENVIIRDMINYQDIVSNVKLNAEFDFNIANRVRTYYQLDTAWPNRQGVNL